MEEKLINIFESYFDDFPVLGKDISTENCEGWDSLTHLKLIISLKKEFKIQFDAGELANMRSFHIIKGMIEQKLK